MVYRVIGLMSGSSLDGLDIVFAEISESSRHWEYEIMHSECIAYDEQWQKRLADAVKLNAYDYLLLHTDYGHYLGQQVNAFIERNGIQYKVGLIASHGHTTFHAPARGMTAQLGDGSAIAAETELPVVSDLRALDLAFGGQGAPIVPIGEQLLFPDYKCFLNIGGIANISVVMDDGYHAFDICPANRVLNFLASKEGKLYDDGGSMAAAGSCDKELLEQLNQLDYYSKPFPKSLANSFGTETVIPIIENKHLATNDALNTCSEHIALQVRNVFDQEKFSDITDTKMLITGGGAFNDHLLKRIEHHLSDKRIEVVLPDRKLIEFKEALIMALIGVLRWRQEYNVLSTVTGSRRNSIGGALWNGQEA